MEYQFKITLFLLIAACCHTFTQMSNHVLSEKIQQIFSAKNATMGRFHYRH